MYVNFVSVPQDHPLMITSTNASAKAADARRQLDAARKALMDANTTMIAAMAAKRLETVMAINGRIPALKRAASAASMALAEAEAEEKAARAALMAAIDGIKSGSFEAEF